MKRIMRLIVTLLSVAMLSSCSSGDDYYKPEEFLAGVIIEQVEFLESVTIEQVEFLESVTIEQVEHVFSPNIRHATIQYGYADIIKDNDGPLFAYVRFPIGTTFADRYISDWAYEIYRNAQNEIIHMQETDEAAIGELNIQFDSYLADDRFAGVVLQGMFTSSALAHPIDIIKIFNIDLENQVFLENTDILDFSQAEDILALLATKIIEVRPDLEGMLEDIDENWLEHIAISSEGVYVFLERAVTLPSYVGTFKILLPFDELDFALLLGKNSEPEPAPEPVPTPPSITQQSRDIDYTRPMIALTFDDGPSKYTLPIVELLERYNARATFFVIGNLVEANRGIVVQTAEAGNEILGHSWDHSNLTKLSADAIKMQLLDTAAIIKTVTGIRPYQFRPPYGSVNDTVKNVAYELGFGIINWSVDTRDWESRNADAVFNAVMNDVRDRAIVLNHDLYESTVQAMERAIPELISRGYQLVTISELLYHSSTPFEAGRVVRNGN